MNRQQKRLLIALALFGVVLFALVLGFVCLPKPVRSKPLALPDGSVVRIVAVTYGTNHVIGPPVWRSLAQLPTKWQGSLRRWQWFGNRISKVRTTRTSDPTMIVWLEGATNNVTTLSGRSSFDVCLADGSGFTSGNSAWLGGWWVNPVELDFHAVPRRDPIITINFFSRNPDGTVRSCGSLPFANPIFGKFPQWQPESLPSTKHACDVAVTLEKFSTGHDNNISYKSFSGGRRGVEFGTNRVERNQNVCFIHAVPLNGTNQAWRVVDAELSDATGNRLHCTGTGWGGESEDYFTFEPGLWLSESAWKLKCEIKRIKGFAPEELLVFKDVPLGRLQATNRVGWTTNLSGVSVTFDYISRRPPQTNNTWSSDKMSDAHFIIHGLTNGLLLDLVNASADNGTNLQFPSWSSSGSEQNYYLKNIPLDATTADFTFAVHRSQAVDFLVKPEVGMARLLFTNQP
jgi:hypothetical protein